MVMGIEKSGWKCVRCGGDLYWSIEPVWVTIFDKSYKVDGVEHYVCQNCGEEEFPGGSEKAWEIAADRVLIDLLEENWRRISNASNCSLDVIVFAWEIVSSFKHKAIWEFPLSDGRIMLKSYQRKYPNFIVIVDENSAQIYISHLEGASDFRSISLDVDLVMSTLNGLGINDNLDSI